ncbi:hypothetical protein [Phnomibacter ginsenosidimutans]|uniref:DUF5678 domain-containing protein n=1 Tax=Phnomibacter ginsenosidimutans TaxID=2676868 RepID=A0A6I6G9K2_9BACT|nr:hypothetical protein [Phnomibacter ginsenosidimutans]QGW26710.1 hypothetical protein GLV81_00055 [Phnomibacter ginsenosidimutans]
MLEIEFKYFLDNKKELVGKYASKFIVIRGQEVVGVFDSEIEALLDSQDKYQAGTFLIQLCDPNEASYSQTFHSRVVFI